MSILINGLEMPTSCPCELIGDGYDLYCSFVWGIPARVKEYDECCQNGTRPSWCPLVPVPPHGRLIDADALLSAYDAEHEGPPGRARALIESTPTIIPASEEGET